MSPGDTDIAASIRSPDRRRAIPVSRGPHDPGDRSPRSDNQDLHDTPSCWSARPRRHGEPAAPAARIVEGRAEGGYTDAFELICCECGDHPYLDYCEVTPRLQRIRGPYTMREGLAAYEKHLGLTT